MAFALLMCSAVIVLCILTNRFLKRFGIPAVLIFIGLGMLFGSEGIVKIPFDNFQIAETICCTALIFIMFYGGFGTSYKEAKPILPKALLLSTAGILITAGLTGLFCYYVVGMSLQEGLLVGAVLSSTDAASVFSILRSKKLNLKEGTASLLEVESGSNDPFAYMLTAVLLTAMESGITPGAVVRLLGAQLIFGLAFGFGVGWAALWLLRRLRLDGSGFETIFVVATALFSYAAPAMLGGNGFLSVYITGILLGNGRLRSTATLVSFFDGVTGIMQMVLFFLLGLLAFPSQMPAVVLPAVGIMLFLTFAARPAAVFLLLAPFRGSRRQKLLVSFAGLRGAASIVFAVMTVISPVSTDHDLFHIVFLIVLFSFSLQGSLLPLAARRLGMIDEGGNVLKTFTDYVDETPVQFIQFTVPDGHAWCGRAVRDLILPPGSLLISLQRGQEQIVPNGDTQLAAGDRLILAALERETLPGVTLTEKEVTAQDLAAGARLADLPRRADALIVLVERGDSYLLPNGDTILQAGDRLVINNTEG